MLDIIEFELDRILFLNNDSDLKHTLLYAYNLCRVALCIMDVLGQSEVKFKIKQVNLL